MLLSQKRLCQIPGSGPIGVVAFLLRYDRQWLASKDSSQRLLPTTRTPMHDLIRWLLRIIGKLATKLLSTRRIYVEPS